jgi:hypothetical protein
LFLRRQEHDFRLGRVNGVPPRVPLQPLRQRYETRFAIWVLQIRRLPVSTFEDEFGENTATRPQLQGHPLVRELNGPTWWEEGDCVMYEEREL